MRPIVEYNSVIWSLVAKHDIELVEKVQRRFTKRLCGLRNLSYCDRLTKLGLRTLELRRLHLELLYCYKIVFRLDNVNFCDFFARSTRLPLTPGAMSIDYLSLDAQLALDKSFSLTE